MSRVRKIVYCFEEDGGGQWASHPANIDYPQCATDPELIELVELKHKLEISIIQNRKANPTKFHEDSEKLQDCLDDIRYHAYDRWPDGDWSAYRTLTIAHMPKDHTVLIQPSHGSEQIMIIDPKAVFLHP